MTFLKFLASKLFLKNLLYAVALLISIFLIFFIVLRIYTHHGQAIPVPDLAGLSVDEAKDVSKKDQFRIEVADSVFNSDLPKGTIIEQNPLPGSKVKKKRRIFVILNAVNPESVKMPNTVGVSHRQAEAMLKNLGLEIGKLIHVPDIAINNVLKQRFNGTDILEGELVPKGSKIDLVLGRGLSDQRTQIPDLFELKLMDAKSRILQSAFNTGAVIYDQSIVDGTDSINARVWRQYPSFEENKLLNLGSTIDIWLSIDSIKFITADTLKLNH
ncbi:MAG: PASTA domain-containing protein [Bacteroidales bacterium]